MEGQFRLITSMNGTTVRRLPGHKGAPQAEPKSKLPHSVTEVRNQHVVQEVESIDRMYLNVIVGRFEIPPRRAAIHPPAEKSQSAFRARFHLRMLRNAASKPFSVPPVR